MAIHLDISNKLSCAVLARVIVSVHRRNESSDEAKPTNERKHTMKKTLAKNAANNRQIIANITTERGYFSVTGEISTASQRSRGDADVSGCIHEELSKAFPKLKPLIALHLSTLDGVPMHAEANGFYWLEGACGGLGSTYHAGNGSSAKTPDECATILADHYRISKEECAGLIDTAKMVKDAKTLNRDFVVSRSERWANEAKAGLALIASL